MSNAASLLTDDSTPSPSDACATCKKPVDALRASAVILLDDGFHYFCSSACQATYLQTEQKAPIEPEKTKRRIRELPFGLPHESLFSYKMKIPMTDVRGPFALGIVTMLSVGAIITAFGVSHSAKLAFSSISIGFFALILWMGSYLISSVGWASWLLPPLGALIAAMGSTFSQEASSWLRAGSILAMLSTFLRVYLDRKMKVRTPHAEESSEQTPQPKPAHWHKAQDKLTLAQKYTRTAEELVGRTLDASPLWSGPFIILLMLSAWFLNQGPHGPSGWSAAASVLIVWPFLGLWRTTRRPVRLALQYAESLGIHFADREALDLAARVDSVVLASARVVTDEAYELIRVVCLEEGSEMPCVSAVAGLEESIKNNPLRDATLAYAAAHGITPEPFMRSTFLPGQGLIGQSQNAETIIFGTRRLLLHYGISSAIAEIDAQTFESEGLTTLFLGTSNRLKAVFCYRRNINPEARSTVQRLMDLPADVLLLSSDHKATTESLGASVDIVHCKAELSREERTMEVLRIRDSGNLCAAVGLAQIDEDILLSSHLPMVLNAEKGYLPKQGANGGVVIEHERGLRGVSDALWIAKITRHITWHSRVTVLALAAFICSSAVVGMMTPAFAAVFGIFLDAFALSRGPYLLRRITLATSASK